MAQKDWRRYHCPIIQAGAILKPFLTRGAARRFCEDMGLKLIAFGNIKAKDGPGQEFIFSLAKANEANPHGL
jgi:hypothetical protein